MTRTFLSAAAGAVQGGDCRGGRLACLAAVLVTSIIGTSALAGSGTPNHPPIPIDDAQLQGLNTSQTLGGAEVLPTTRTIPHWWRSIRNPNDGVTYGFNMAGADPYGCSGWACYVTIEVDITPMILNVDGMTFSGTDIIVPLLNSPVFAVNDYGSTPYATQWSGDLATPPTRGPGGPLSQADAGQLLQLQDAIMRAQFKQTGVSNYHLKLQPNVLPSVTIDVPAGQGFLFQNRRGVVSAFVDGAWWATQVHNQVAKSDPTHLALIMTDDVITYRGNERSFTPEALGYHGADITERQTNGNAPVHTFAWAGWLSPGVYARPNGGFLWNYQDIDTVSHEISEWANDPFGTNDVQPWLAPFPLTSFCSPLLETGDPVDIVGFAMGTNTFRQGPNPNGTQSADGYYHAQDEAFLPWFMRLSPNNISEPTQTPSPNVGRYTFVGDLNIFNFKQPPPTCTVTFKHF